MSISRLYEVKDTGTRGLGLFAIQNIKAGTQIIEEKPLILVPRDALMRPLIVHLFNKLAPAEKVAYMALYARKTSEEETEASDSTTRTSKRHETIPRPFSRCDERKVKGADLCHVVHCMLDCRRDYGVDAKVIFDERDVADVHAVGSPAVHLAKSADKSQGQCSDSESAYLTAGIGCTLPYTNVADPRSHKRHDSGIDEDRGSSFRCTAKPALSRDCLSLVGEDVNAQDIINIFETNALGCEIKDDIVAAVCLEAARLNHSCVPNVFCAFDVASGTHFVHAIKNISVGEEILNCYIASTYMTTEERQSELAKWGFKCECPVCSPQAERSDERRRMLGHLREGVNETKGLFETGQCSPKRAADAVENITKMMELMEEEGLVGAEMADLCGAAGLCSLRADQHRRAVIWLQKKIEVMRRCYGSNSAHFRREERGLEGLLVQLTRAAL